VRYALREDGEPQSPAVGINPLTKREKEVAELVADGMSNKQIAERLVISLRTAEGHVEKILSKQGFTTRTQIASWVTRQRAART
jgi:DNA-binding NarL/FixJ family response regulator